MKLSYSLMSNNYGWATVPNGQNAWKWEPFYPTLSSFYPTEDHFLSLGLTGNCKSELWSAYVTTADNVKHPAAVTSGNLNSVTCQSYSAVTLETIDGSGFQIYSADPNNSAQTFTDRSGVVWNRSTGTRTDANGNEITSTLSGSGSVSDTLGRTVPGLPSPGNANGNSTTTNYTGCGPLTVTSAVLWKVLGPDGGTSTFKFCYANITIATDFGVANTSEYSGTINMLESVVLPNGTAWTFYYDNYGDVVEVKFPTGGYLSYTYSNLVFPFCYNDQTGSQVWTEPTVHYRKVYDGTNTNTWTYSWGASGQYNPGSTVAATSTDPDLPPISVHVRIRQLSAAPSSV
jgi:YD repeat-containing protein